MKKKHNFKQASRNKSSHKFSYRQFRNNNHSMEVMNKCNTKEIDFSSKPNPSILASIAPLSFERKKGTISVFPEFKVIRHLLTNTLHCMPYIRFQFRNQLNYYCYYYCYYYYYYYYYYFINHLFCFTTSILYGSSSKTKINGS